mmetsp:Transcript_2014/g.5385  ORF Transcript_2014/g.5385 Transcript_2014/m.5385 type:complete len:255 (-) Transcript_2014:89-853(-)
MDAQPRISAFTSTPAGSPVQLPGFTGLCKSGPRITSAASAPVELRGGLEESDSPLGLPDSTPGLSDPAPGPPGWWRRQLLARRSFAHCALNCAHWPTRAASHAHVSSSLTSSEAAAVACSAKAARPSCVPASAIPSSASAREPSASPPRSLVSKRPWVTSKPSSGLTVPELAAALTSSRWSSRVRSAAASEPRSACTLAFASSASSSIGRTRMEWQTSTVLAISGIAKPSSPCAACSRAVANSGSCASCIAAGE